MSVFVGFDMGYNLGPAAEVVNIGLFIEAIKKN